MTTVSIDNKLIEQSQDTKSINEVSQTILKNQIKKESVISKLILDGVEYNYDEDLEIMKEPLNSFKSVNFQTVNSVDLAFQALESCQEYIDTLSENVIKLSKAYQQSNFEQANLLFADVIELLDLYIQLVSRIYSTIKRNRPSLIGNTQAIQNLEIHLLSVLKALIPAKENNDYIMLCDLLEYELIDNLTQWKIKVIPNLKKLRNI